jgi:hypothetical protein
MNVEQLRDYIIKPTLLMLGYNSDSAINLLLGTCAQETAMGEYIVQKGLGLDGGIGIYQMEMPTYHYIYDKYITQNLTMQHRFRIFLGYDGRPHAARMASDLFLATAMARLYYYSIPERLPGHDDIRGLAKYWKKHWNTSLGKGRIEQFIANYQRYITQDSMNRKKSQ